MVLTHLVDQVEATSSHRRLQSNLNRETCTVLKEGIEPAIELCLPLIIGRPDIIRATGKKGVEFGLALLDQNQFFPKRGFAWGQIILCWRSPPPHQITAFLKLSQWSRETDLICLLRHMIIE